MNTTPDAVSAPLPSEIHLIGVPPLADFVDNVKRRAGGGHDDEELVSIDQWRTLRCIINGLKKAKPGKQTTLC